MFKSSRRAAKGGKSRRLHNRAARRGRMEVEAPPEPMSSSEKKWRRIAAISEELALLDLDLFQAFDRPGLRLLQTPPWWEFAKCSRPLWEEPGEDSWLPQGSEPFVAARKLAREALELVFSMAPVPVREKHDVLGMVVGRPEDITAACAIAGAYAALGPGARWDVVCWRLHVAPVGVVSREFFWSYLGRYRGDSPLTRGTPFTKRELARWVEETVREETDRPFRKWKSWRLPREHLDLLEEIREHHHGWAMVSESSARQLANGSIGDMLPRYSTLREKGIPFHPQGYPAVSPKRALRLLEEKAVREMKDRYASDPRIAPEWTLTSIPEGVTQLRTPLEMGVEGVQQHNCCATWVDPVMEGKYAFFSVQVAEERATLLLTGDGRLCELRGPCNGKPGRQAYERIRSMVTHELPAHGDYVPEYEPNPAFAGAGDGFDGDE
jgi:hypothetical protein